MKGKIVGTVEEVGSEGPVHHSIIEYSIHAGEVLRIKRKMGWASPPEEFMVEVFYSQNKPGEMVENSFFTKYGLASILIGSGLI